MQVILRPIGWNKWSGVKKYKNCYDDLGTYYTRSGVLYTGLTTEDEQRLGVLLGVNLAKKINAGEKGIIDNPYWSNFFIRTAVSDILLDTEDPFDELKYLFCKSHKRVKTSLLENKATADFALINREEEAKVENSLVRTKREAYREFDKLTPTEIRKVLRLFGYNADNMSNEVAENKLSQFIEANPKKFIDKWVGNKTREVEVLIETAIAKNIIRRNKNIYKYGSEIIGTSLQDTIDYLSLPNNQDIRVAIMNACDVKDFYMAGESTADEVLTSKVSDIVEKKTTKTNKQVDND